MRTLTLAVLIAASAIGAPAANSSLGFLTTDGSFQLDQSKIWGTATLFDGSVVETTASPCRVHLGNGAEIQLAAESRARFFEGRAVIEKGALRLQSSGGYRVEARSFQISANAAKTVAGVKLQGTAGVAASTVSGSLLVTNVAGALLADVPAGSGVTVTPEPGGAAGLTKLSGCVLSMKKSIVLVDQASNVTFAVHGDGVEHEVGNRIEITGTAQPSSSQSASNPRMVEVTQLKQLEKGVCTAPTAKKGPLAAAAGAIGAKTAAAGALIVAKPVAIAIISGVAVAGSVGGLEAARALASDQPADTSR